MNITPPKPITLRVAKMSMPDPVPGYINQWDKEQQEIARQDQIRHREQTALADHYVMSEWKFDDYMEALDCADDENKKRLMDLFKARDAVAFELQFRQMVEAYAWRVAEIKT